MTDISHFETESDEEQYSFEGMEQIAAYIFGGNQRLQVDLNAPENIIRIDYKELHKKCLEEIDKNPIKNVYQIKDHVAVLNEEFGSIVAERYEQMFEKYHDLIEVPREYRAHLPDIQKTIQLAYFFKECIFYASSTQKQNIRDQHIAMQQQQLRKQQGDIAFLLEQNEVKDQVIKFLEQRLSGMEAKLAQYLASNEQSISKPEPVANYLNH